MADIVINGGKCVRGKLSITRQADISKSPVEIVVTGVLSTHRYFEEITDIETMRYRLSGVQVLREDFGSDDHQIMYTFTAEELEVKGKGKACESIFNDQEVENIECEIYPGIDINERGEYLDSPK